MDTNQAIVEDIKKRIDPAFGKTIAVDEGWYQIIIDCHNSLTVIDPDYVICQIKEKFGQLRYYIQPSLGTSEENRDRMYEVIHAAEKLSLQTCEATGQSGVLMTNNRNCYKTLNVEYASITEHLKKYRIAFSAR